MQHLAELIAWWPRFANINRPNDGWETLLAKQGVEWLYCASMMGAQPAERTCAVLCEWMAATFDGLTILKYVACWGFLCIDPETKPSFTVPHCRAQHLASNARSHIVTNSIRMRSAQFPAVSVIVVRRAINCNWGVAKCCASLHVCKPINVVYLHTNEAKHGLGKLFHIRSYDTRRWVYVCCWGLLTDLMCVWRST